MNWKNILPFAVGAFFLSNVMAQDQVIAPSPSSRLMLDLYEMPGALQSVGQISVSEAGFPLVIENTQMGRHKVAIGEKKYWLRGMQVQIKLDRRLGCNAPGDAAFLGQATTGVTVRPERKCPDHENQLKNQSKH